MQDSKWFRFGSNQNIATIKETLAKLSRSTWLVGVIDLALVATAVLMVITHLTVLFFHIIFVLLALGAFFWKFRGFAARALFWVSLTTGLVLRAVLSGETQPDELIEIPLLTAILVLIFAIAARRAQTQIRLAEEEAFIATVLENTEEGFVACDNAGKLTVFNRAAQEFFGTLASSLIGNEWHNPDCLYDANGRLLAREEFPLLRALRGDSVRDHEMLLKTETAAPRTLLTSARKLTTAGRGIGAVVVLRDISQQKLFDTQLQRQAFHDPLTKLPNRALFMDRLEHAWTRATRNQSEIAVLFMDLDRFKVVNDTLGHEIGDKLLIAVGERVQGCLRRDDTVARLGTLSRLGGDELAVLLEDMPDVGHAISIAQRITEAMHGPFHLDGANVFTSTSIGIALGGTGYERPSDILRDADVALYRAKAQGKARFEVFAPEMNERGTERLTLENDLRRALDEAQFRIYYQPTIEVLSGRMTGVEALLRWQHPKYGLLAPADFIPIAEETGMIRPIGNWVLEQACRQARIWEDEFAKTTPLKVSINVSARQFHDTSFVLLIAQILARTGASPSNIQLEITENVLMENVPANTLKLRDLQRLGIKLALDDFGKGYSSLSYLKWLPLDTLKIDKSFVEGLGKDVGDSAIFQAVLALANNLGLQVIAEGVETIEQLRVLRTLGCETVQGYYFAKPMPPTELSKLGNLVTPNKMQPGQVLQVALPLNQSPTATPRSSRA